jgi:tetratricopeptide (TPR) repeat protein
MKLMLVAAFFATVFSVNAETQPRGADRLRELVVFPKMDLIFGFSLNQQDNKWVISQMPDLPGEITEQRNELQHHPSDAQQLMHLGYLLLSDGETNESRSCYQKAEQLCRDKIAANPQDGLALVALGESLDALGKKEEAESNFRKATLVSSNEWQCWVGLGNFLPNVWFASMFPTNLRNQIVPGRMLSQEAMDYRPSVEALGRAEAACREASRCFDRAMILAPEEPEVFVQRAGYMSTSNWQDCFFQHCHNNVEINPKDWLLSFFSRETIANLRKAAELNPKDYQCISFATYFEYFVPKMQANKADFTIDQLPDATRQSIQKAKARLENRSRDPDKKTAAGALEYLGFLNFIFGDKIAAAANFRLALALDPTREQAWDMLLATTGAGSREEAVAVCEARLKQKESARNQLLLARALEHQEKWDKAGEQAEAALIMDSNNIVGHLELLALAIRQSVDTNFMAKAGEQITRTEEAYEKLPDNNEKQSRWRELTLNLAILDGLANAPEYKKAARVCLEAVLKNYPDDKQAKEISNALQ